eukprot:scaffold207_cov409-Prasinococcus_capsulatus_cf.AAC.86
MRAGLTYMLIKISNEHRLRRFSRPAPSLDFKSRTGAIYPKWPPRFSAAARAGPSLARARRGRESRA